jgi:ribA/ribD-fused uncharacterized protein
MQATPHEFNMSTNAITEFRGAYTRLSNYAICSVWFDGHIYNSVEHAYQAAKSLDEDERRAIRHLPTANQAKKAGRRVTIRPDWEAVKVEIMRGLLREKFAQEPDRTVLLGTGRRELVEGNWWGDRFWGQSPLGNGENWLGRLLMEIREELRGTDEP